MGSVRQFMGQLFRKKTSTNAPARRSSSARSWAATIFVALTLRAFVVGAYEIPSGSMIPTLQVGDRIWVNKLVYGVRIPFSEIKLAARSPRRGEIIVFSHPKTPDVDLIKRVVAVGGDTVEVREGQLYVNGEAVPSSPAPEPRSYFDVDPEQRWEQRECTAQTETIGRATFTTLHDPGRMPRSFPLTRVPQGSLFVMGDNRDNSNDSRYWGFVPLNLVRGRAMVVWWSHGEPEGVRLSRIGHLIE